MENQSAGINIFIEMGVLRYDTAKNTIILSAGISPIIKMAGLNIKYYIIKAVMPMAGLSFLTNKDA